MSERAASGDWINVRDCGAIGDGLRLDTEALQAAIDEACKAGGCGRVRVPAGTYRTGTLWLRSHLQLELAAGAVLLGSPEISDYPRLADGGHKDLQPFHLLILDGLEDVCISGSGWIDGNGPSFWEPQRLPSGWYRELEERPSPLIECLDCRGLVWENVGIRRSPGWTLHFKRCEDVQVRGIRIQNHLYGPNTDGIDINGCRDVRVADCLIEAGDDAIVLKTTPDSQSCERVTVTNCTITTRCRALKLGANESYLDMRDVVFSNCVVRESVAVVGIYCRRGATLENIAVSNIVGYAFANKDYNQPVHIDLGCRDEQDTPGRIRNVALSNLILHSNGRILITGHPQQPAENISLHQIQLHLRDLHDPFPGGLSATGNQFSPSAPQARAARAAIVVENTRQVDLHAIRIYWPPNLPAPFHAIWLHNACDTAIPNPLPAASHPHLPPVCHFTQPA